MMSLKELRKKAGLNQGEFCEYFGIPRRTVQNWEYKTVAQNCPDYLLKLIEYKLRKEGLVSDIPDEQPSAHQTEDSTRSEEK